MARTKKTLKAKEPVKIRFKQLAHGNQSIYLDCYVDGVRTYETLNLYLIPEATPTDKIQNRNTMLAAKKIQADRIAEIINGKAGLSKKITDKTKLIDWIEYCAKLREKEPQGANLAKNMRTVAYHIDQFNGSNDLLIGIDTNYCRAFSNYLQASNNKWGKRICKSTAAIYFECFSLALKEAARQNKIDRNPVDNMTENEKPKRERGHRDFLNIEELKAMMQTDCPKQEVKQAFMFSCFCGLRLSDIEALTWDNIKTRGEQKRLQTTMIKTGGVIDMAISTEALKWLPQIDDAKQKNKIFNMPSRATLSRVLKVWAQEAGINDKEITFHVARHTCATLLLSLGAEITTISKILGHTSVTTTQIYAEVLDEAKTKAVSLTDGIF